MTRRHAPGTHRALPLCADCGAVTGFVRFHPLRRDLEVRQCLNCELRFTFALDGSHDTLPSRKKHGRSKV